MSRALVTGASGFIGRRLVARLLEGASVLRALVRAPETVESWSDRVEVVAGDVRDPDRVRAAVADVETVFHLAATVHDLRGIRKGEHWGVTVEGTRNVLDAAQAAGVKRLVFVSSLAVYGEPSVAQRDESEPHSPRSAYGRAKATAERLVLTLGQTSGIHVSCLRPALVYEPGCKGNLPRMIAMIDRGLFPPPPEVGTRRSLVHVENLVDAVLLAATHWAASGRDYIVADRRAYSTRELYDIIRQALGKPASRWAVPRGVLTAFGQVGDLVGAVRGRSPGFDSDVVEKLFQPAWFSADRIARELGFDPRWELVHALPEMIAQSRSRRRDA